MQVSEELVMRIFPGMALMSPEPFCAAELWSLLDLLPYKARFEVYDAVQVSCSNCLHQSVKCTLSPAVKLVCCSPACGLLSVGIITCLA